MGMDAKEIYQRADDFVREMTKEPPKLATKPGLIRYRHIIIKYGVMIRELARLIAERD